jgi:hypothetical protein
MVLFLQMHNSATFISRCNAWLLVLYTHTRLSCAVGPS